jgi:hypothetical protein
VRKKKEPEPPAPLASPAPKAPAPPSDGIERLTANEWAMRHQVNEVQAERAAMYAGKWHTPLTEAEFMELLRDAKT